MGVRVSVSTAERGRLHAHASQLGIASPCDREALRHNWGRCALLDDDHSCRLHAAFGASAKPLVCRQYPWVALRTAEGLRVGVDPGCTNGPAANGCGPPSVLLETRVPAADLADEQRCLSAQLHDLDDILVHIGLDRPAALHRARCRGALPWSRALASPDLGPMVRGALAGPLQARWPPPLLDATATASSLRMVWLRLAPSLTATEVLDLAVTGALLTATAPREAQQVRLAAWFRVIRLPPIAAAIIAAEAETGTATGA